MRKLVSKKQARYKEEYFDEKSHRNLFLDKTFWLLSILRNCSAILRARVLRQCFIEPGVSKKQTWRKVLLKKVHQNFKIRLHGFPTETFRNFVTYL